jgi:hypothetical protein
MGDANLARNTMELFETKNKPNQSLQPTPGSVTPPAGAGVAPVPSVADL